MPAQLVVETVTGTGELTFTMVGEFDPWGTLLERLGRLPEASPPPPRWLRYSRRGAAAGRLARHWPLMRRELWQLAYEVTAGRDFDRRRLLGQLSLTADQLRVSTERHGASEDVRRWADALARQLEQIGLALVCEHPPTADGPVLLDAFGQLLGLTAPLDRRAPAFASADAHQLLRFGYGSPWYVEASVFLGGGTSLSGLLFGLKRICGIDLEIRLRRTELKVQLEEARQRLRRIEQFEAERRGRLEWADRAAEPEPEQARVDRVALLERVRNIDFFPWSPKHATLSDED